PRPQPRMNGKAGRWHCCGQYGDREAAAPLLRRGAGCCVAMMPHQRTNAPLTGLFRAVSGAVMIRRLANVPKRSPAGQAGCAFQIAPLTYVRGSDQVHLWSSPPAINYRAQLNATTLKGLAGTGRATIGSWLSNCTARPLVRSEERR